MPCTTHIFVTLSAKSSLILEKNKAAFRREGHYVIWTQNGYTGTP